MHLEFERCANILETCLQKNLYILKYTWNTRMNRTFMTCNVCFHYCNLFENIICLSQDEPEELFLWVVRLIDLNSRWQQLVGVERMCVAYKGEQFELSWWALALTGNTGFVRGGYFAIADDSDRGSSATRRSQRAIRGCSIIGFQET